MRGAQNHACPVLRKHRMTVLRKTAFPRPRCSGNADARRYVYPRSRYHLMRWFRNRAQACPLRYVSQRMRCHAIAWFRNHCPTVTPNRNRSRLRPTSHYRTCPRAGIHRTRPRRAANHRRTLFPPTGSHVLAGLQACEAARRVDGADLRFPHLRFDELAGVRCGCRALQRGVMVGHVPAVHAEPALRL